MCKNNSKRNEKSSNKYIHKIWKGVQIQPTKSWFDVYIVQQIAFVKRHARTKCCVVKHFLLFLFFYFTAISAINMLLSDDKKNCVSIDEEKERNDNNQ